MSGRILKYFRVVISLLFLVTTGFLFLDFTGILASSLINGITWIQFVPSLVKFLNLLGFLALGFVVVMGATLLFGRVYCSTVCPLGILQDAVSRVSRFYTTKIRGLKSLYRPKPARNLLRYSLLGVTILSFLFGSVFFLNLLDPFSVFGKIVSGLARPVYYSANNLAADILNSFGIYTLYRVDTRQMSLLPLIFPAFMLGLIVFLSWKKGRLYCNTVCPVGSFLGLISKFAIYRIEIDKALCTRCAECSVNCKAQCIDLKKQQIDFSRCVGCFNCVNVCSLQGIGYRNQWFRSEEKPAFSHALSDHDAGSKQGGAPHDNDRSAKRVLKGAGSSVSDDRDSGDSCDRRVPDYGRERRRFLFRLTAYFVGFSAASRIVNAETGSPAPRAEDAGVVVTQPSTIPEKKEQPISPPGSKGLTHFTKSCTGCQLCVSVCPTGVLQPSFLEYGFTGMMQPRLDYHASFCNFDCVKCTEVCPTGAILPLTVAQKHVVQVGVVRLELDNCVVKTEGTACGACAEHCPTQAVRMAPYKAGLTIPEILSEHCIGCGACEYICPTRPYRAIYVDGKKVHKEAVPPVFEELDYQPPEDDFPF